MLVACASRPPRVHRSRGVCVLRIDAAVTRARRGFGRGETQPRPALQASRSRPRAGAYTRSRIVQRGGVSRRDPPGAGSRILQTEYTTWIAQDRHARAAEVLSQRRCRCGWRRSSASARRSRARSASRATPRVLPRQQAHVRERRRELRGVSRARERLARPRIPRKGWTHAQSVQAGMSTPRIS